MHKSLAHEASIGATIEDTNIIIVNTKPALMKAEQNSKDSYATKNIQKVIIHMYKSLGHEIVIVAAI